MPRMIPGVSGVFINGRQTPRTIISRRKASDLNVARAARSRGGALKPTKAGDSLDFIPPPAAEGLIGDLVGGALDLIPGGGIIKKGADILGGLFGGDDGPMKFQPGRDPCPGGFELRNGRCVAVTPTPGFGGFIERTLPGGSTGMTAAGGQAVVGGFGLPAIAPAVELREVRKCPSGMVLGRDNLCYPKRVLSRRSNLRKWKGDRKPPVTAADMKAIRRAARAKKRVKELGKDVGLKVTNR